MAYYDHAEELLTGWRIVDDGSGVNFSHSFTEDEHTGAHSPSLGDPMFIGIDAYKVRYFVDANVNGSYEQGEDVLASNNFVVIPRERYVVKIQFSSLIPSAERVEAQALFESVTNFLLKKDQADDYRASVTLEVGTILAPFTPDAIRQDPMPDTYPAATEHWNSAADIVFVSQIQIDPAAPSYQTLGVTDENSWHRIVIDWSFDPITGKVTGELIGVLAHEFGHGVGLGHAGHVLLDLMHDEYVPATYRLLEADAIAFESGADR